ncbi:hypothetical protein NTGBS_330025 [Candidatus Nitrotoga sp. BS]|uniref:toll/interleukin-1 receptor domain-containing protein n=1 Tax=Candidatus Nitrotoga sp. BS TaxID=2890408 RepID=UPI001EF2D2C0|nr:toll/interleukin-1 receptor domain-containing protein [Candidatus Nitrotoga sp. BS]CAH1198642.1 hypothetical protein NTGBS_330025 [Candidatus Nitrotoga sp. BS]
MFGLSKPERFSKAVAKLLQTDYYLSKLQAEALAAELITHVKPHIELPEQAALPIAAVGAKMLYDAKHLDRAEQLNRRVRIVGAELLRQGKIHKGQLAELLSHLPSLQEASDDELDQCPSNTPPTRVQCVRAGWAFTFYWQIYSTDPALKAKASPAEDSSITTPLLSAFANSRTNLEWVSAQYQRGNGSNDVLRRALGGSPEYTLYWFRMGQVVNTLLDTGISPEEKPYLLGELAVRGNVSAAGVSTIDCDRLLDTARQARDCHRKVDSQERLMRLVSGLHECLIEIAAKHDNLEEFERKSKAHGGVFISYSHADTPLVQTLTKRLGDKEIAYWLDENEVTPGNYVSSTLSEGIDSNCVFLLVVSQASLRSEWVAFEIDRALGRAKDGAQICIPVLANGVTHGDLPAKLQGVVSFQLGESIEGTLPKLIEAVQEHLVQGEYTRRSRSRADRSAA